MNLPTTTPGSTKRAWQVAAAMTVPLIVAVCALPFTLFLVDTYGWELVPFILAGWCCILLLSALWLNRAFFQGAKTLLPSIVAIIVMISLWVWQRVAFVALVPQAALRYGYFLEPKGSYPRFWVLALPVSVGLTSLALCCTVSLVLAWRAGARRSLAWQVPWWVATLVVFGLPSLYLDAQGNASVFI